MSDNKEFLLGLISTELGLDVGNIRLDHSFEDDLGVDSFGHVQIVIAVEMGFRIGEISDEIADSFKKVQDILDYLEKLSDESD